MKVKLGEYIEFYKEKCGISKLTKNEVSGIDKDKNFICPVSQLGNDTNNYQYVPQGYFACNLMHVGRDFALPIALNSSNKKIIVSPAYIVFRIKEHKEMLSDFLLMYFKKAEFERFLAFNTDSSIRESLELDRFCDIEIDLPDIEVQRKFVAVYKAMVENQKAYETGLEDLKLTCDAYIENLRRKMPVEPIGKYIEPIARKNTDNEIDFVCGVESTGKFMNTKAIMDGIATNKYEVISEREFAYNPSRINLGSIALCEKQCIVSPMYVHFGVRENAGLIPEYLAMWFARKEFQRSTLFYAMGSVRDTFGFDLMQEVQIPIPDIEIQEAIVAIYNAYILRREINERLKLQIKDICRVLIKGASNGF